MLKFTLIAIFTAALLMWGRLLFKRTKPKQLSESGGVIQLVRWIGWLVVLFGGAMIVAVLYGYCSGELTWGMTLVLGVFCGFGDFRRGTCWLYRVVPDVKT